MLDDPTAPMTLFEPPPPTTLNLADRFVIPPFSVLDGRSGPWQERKRRWLDMGIRSELGRDDKLLDYDSIRTAGEKDECETCGGTGNDPHSVAPKKCQHCKGTGRKFANYASMGAGTSVFDPVVCELAYRWFSPPGGAVLDPFAGGSVRGIVAGVLCRDYVGIDLRQEQVASNYEQAAVVLAGREPVGEVAWVAGDSRALPQLVGQGEIVDFVFSCPPYYDLEKYSTDPNDLSNAGEYHDFLAAYRDIIGHACAALKPDRFAAWVVGEVRRKDGNYHGFVPDTIKAFEDHGVRFYNEAILVTPLGTAPVRASSLFPAGRKMVKAHQNVLVFCKGSPQVAANLIPLPGVGTDPNAEAWITASEAAAVVA